MRILLVDDNEDIRRLATMSLARVGGHEVQSVSGGTACLDELTRWQPDAIVLDVMMPDMDGPSTLAAIRDNPATMHIPVVFLTASVVDSELDRLRGLQVSGLLRKPFDPMTLASQVDGLLGW